jgi:hypothetical protein
MAVPREFDVRVTQSDDHAAVRAVEAELRRHGVPFFRAEGAGSVNRFVELHVRWADRDRASQLAGMIFARRKRLEKAFPRPRPLPEMPGSTPGGGIDGISISF